MRRFKLYKFFNQKNIDFIMKFVNKKRWCKQKQTWPVIKEVDATWKGVKCCLFR